LIPQLRRNCSSRLWNLIKKKDVTAVASIAAKDMNQGAVVNPLQLISGKLAGLILQQTGSEPVLHLVLEYEEYLL
jgi:hypothetical protein